MVNETLSHLGKRERQITEVLYRLGEASVAEVLQSLDDPPSYSAVRAMLNLLVEKRVAKFRREGKRYLYRPVAAKDKVSRTALRNLVATFFGGQPTEAMAALIDTSAGSLTADDFERMKRLIEQAEQSSSS